MTEIKDINEKQIEQEQQIKRLNQVINALCEEAKLKEKKIKDIEDNIISMQQVLMVAH